MKTNEMNEQKCKKKITLVIQLSVFEFYFADAALVSHIQFWIYFRWLYCVLIVCFLFFFYCMRHAVTEHTFVQQRWAIKKSKKKKKRLEQYSIDNVNTINLYRYCWCRNAHLFLRFFERINWPWCVLCIRRYFPFSFSW